MYTVTLSCLFDYVVDGKTITSTDKHPYLGITLHKTMQWSHHIDGICKKASKVLNFIWRNLSKCSTEVKSTAYLTLVRPIMEYAASAWDPHQQYLIDNIEKFKGGQPDGSYLIIGNNQV